MVSRLTYAETQNIILVYAPEMAQNFADKFSRFPRGGVAATIVNYLNDRADFWRSIDSKIADKIINAATEIIVRADNI